MTDAPAPVPVRTRPRWPGVVAAGLGVLTVAGLVTGLVLASADLFEPATWTAWATIGVSAAAVLLGLVAVLARLGRAAGIAGIVLGVLADPLVLVHGLAFLGRLGS